MKPFSKYAYCSCCYRIAEVVTRPWSASHDLSIWLYAEERGYKVGAALQTLAGEIQESQEAL